MKIIYNIPRNAGKKLMAYNLVFDHNLRESLKILHNGDVKNYPRALELLKKSDYTKAILHLLFKLKEK